MHIDLVSLSCKFEVRSFDDGINRTSLLAKSTVDTLGHVNIVPANYNSMREENIERGQERTKEDPSPSCPATSIFSFLCLNCDSLCRAYLVNNHCLLR